MELSAMLKVDAFPRRLYRIVLSRFVALFVLHVSGCDYFLSVIIWNGTISFLTIIILGILILDRVIDNK